MEAEPDLTQAAAVLTCLHLQERRSVGEEKELHSMSFHFTTPGPARLLVCFHSYCFVIQQACFNLSQQEEHY